jgi:hypothetical protein
VIGRLTVTAGGGPAGAFGAVADDPLCWGPWIQDETVDQARSQIDGAGTGAAGAAAGGVEVGVAGWLGEATGAGWTGAAVAGAPCAAV